ncbi:hypothetical protein GGR55DRAFT_619057 [Xylaria sp. FL0064]|nr:hypothetical protein GGR55DRAFT_619057 [Xylaria sp. FL0064]
MIKIYRCQRSRDHHPKIITMKTRQQVVHRDSSENVRGIWVLEAKDLLAMHWETQGRPGRRVPATVSQPQWPFPLSRKREDGEDGSSAKEPDELMAWLRR